MRRLTRSQARRIALAAQGLARPRPDRRATMRDLQRVVDAVAQFQIDSVNVAVRAHYMPLFSRLGPYETALLDRAFGQSPRRLVEYWGHAASLIDVNLFPALRFRMERQRERPWLAELNAKHPGILDQVLHEVTAFGPVTARQIKHEEERSRDHWGWNWSSAKIALEWQFSKGRITSARRNSQFERVYDLPVRVLPARVFHSESLSEADQRVELARRAARALGVFSEACVAAYFMTDRANTGLALASLEAAGEIERVEVTGWPVVTWQVTGTTVPRRAQARALLSPFDSMMFHRDRVHALFDYFYRIEIYVPQPQRLHGYYVYSFLLGEEFVARVDLKADRAAGELVVKAAWLEPGRSAAPELVASELAAELQVMASWLGLTRVRVEPRGDFAEACVSALASSN